ncbi:MAG TPA: YSC84-related protein [Gammaproteobacteria bacterium]
MRRRTASYGALAAAVVLACGVANAQEREELSEAERAEVERQTEELRQRTEQLERQTEQLDEQTDELAEGNEAVEEREQEIAERSAEAAEEDAEAVADEQELEQRRNEIMRMAEETLDQLREQNPSAAALYEEAHGYAVFDTTKGGLIVTGAGGTGVAMEKDGGEPIFMHLGQAGVGLGAGLENYRLVMLLEDQETYDRFVSGQWDGSLSAQASAGEEGVAAEEQFVDGVKVYRLTDRGLMAQADVSGIRFWPSEELNETQIAEADDDRDSDREPDASDRARETLDDAEDEVDDAVR